MNGSVDIGLADLLVSRFAHELVGPMGAVNNGLELVEELGVVEAGDAIDLVSRSAKSAGAKLQFYRAAYGRAGQSMTKIADLRALAAGLFDTEDKVELIWPLPPVLPSLEDGEGRLILLLLEVAMGSLHRGGVVTISLGDSIEVRAEGDGAQLDAGVVAAMDGSADDVELTPRTVHGRLAQQQAGRVGRRLEIGLESGMVRLTAMLS